MRYLVNDMGWEKFQNLVLKERALVRSTQSVIVKLKINGSDNEIKRSISVSNESSSMPDGFTRWKNTNVVRQKQKGYNSVSIALESGDISAIQLRSIAQFISDFSGAVSYTHLTLPTKA